MMKLPGICLFHILDPQADFYLNFRNFLVSVNFLPVVSDRIPSKEKVPQGRTR